MKKSVKMILCLALVLASLFCLVACGGSKDNIVGSYEFYSMKMEGETIKAKDLEDFGLESDDITLKIKKNGTAILEMAGETIDMEWEDGEIWPEGEEDEAVEYKFKGGKLTFEAEGAEMVFKKK